MTLSLRYRGEAEVPLEVEGVTPCTMREKTVAEIERVEVFHGNRAAALADFFDVSGDAGDERHVWEGDLSGVHWIGAKTQSGEIRLAGAGGRHIGSEMSGGSILVEGDAGDWVGGEMHGGRIHVKGRAGHLVGAAYRGSARGMTGGSILIDGDAGNEIGHSMRRGLIAIGGNIGDLAGFNMLAGSILAFGEVGIRHGAGMKRGTLAFFGEAPTVLPSFRHACRFRPDVMSILVRQLQRDGFAAHSTCLDCDFELYNGDLIEGGRGELLVRV